MNDAPTFTSTAGTSVNEDSFYTYDITTDEIDNDPILNEIHTGDTLVISAPIKPARFNLIDNGDGTATLSGIPINSQVGTHNVTLRVSDGTVDVDQSFTITVINTNDAPIFTSTSISNVSINEDSLYSYSVTSSDVDISDTLTLSTPTKPAWLNLSDNGNGTGILSGTPLNADVGEHQITLRVNDGTVDVKQSFTVIVLNVNNETSVFTSTPITSVDKNTLYRYDITISDADIGDQLTLTAPLKPAWLTFTDNGDGTALLSGTPTEAEIGFHEVTLRVNDGTVDIDQSFTVSVNDVVFLEGIVLKCEGGSFKEAYLETAESQPVNVGNYQFLASLVGFEIENLTHSSVVVSVIFNNINKLDNLIYRKYGPVTPGDPNSADWYTFSNVAFELETIGGQTVVKASLTLTDGVLGDDTGVDGRIVDAGGIARAVTPSPVVSNPVGTECATGGSVSGSCNAGEQTFATEVEVSENASVARATFESDVENKGMISNSTISPGATLTGGKLTGTITNEGTIADVNFVSNCEFDNAAEHVQP